MELTHLGSFMITWPDYLFCLFIFIYFPESIYRYLVSGLKNRGKKRRKLVEVSGSFSPPHS